MSEFGPGFRSGRLTVKEPVKGGKFWLCLCDCGQERSASKWHLKKGIAKSCGCRIKEPPQSYQCTVCQINKPRDDFYARKNGRLYFKECKECNKRKQRDRERLKRLKALVNYSKSVENPLGIPTCDCCQERRLQFLVLDHKNNDGGQHRRLEGLGTKISIWKWLEKNNYPTDLGLRVLCANCNHSHGAYGYCPHNDDEITFRVDHESNLHKARHRVEFDQLAATFFKSKGIPF